MIKFLIQRPVAVCMAFTVFTILGIITYFNVPVSLLPNIPIPEITVQVSGKNKSARELENTVVTPIRQQLLQIGKLRDIRTETRDESAIIRLSFEYGANTDLSFIEVNEKIDAAMNYIPRDIERPRVIKASATDIPVFTLNLTLKNLSPDPSPQGRGDGSNTPLLWRGAGGEAEEAFLDLSELSETVIKRQIEQLPQVAMVDMTGMMNKEVVIKPDNNLLAIAGISLSDIEAALTNNNIEPGSMIVRDGYYEYNIKFSSVLRTLDDIRNIYIRKNDKIFQLKDFAGVNMMPEKEKGVALYNGKRAIMLAVIKQADENMTNMQNAMNKVIGQLKEDYPDIDFDTSQNQTTLLDYTISNLQQNLLSAFLFVWLISALFMGDFKSPLIVGINMSVALIVSLMFFYLFHISMNIVSLTGLILALGLMIDSSIIVTDNIGQHRQRGLSLDDACVKGVNEVIAPILSSSFTHIAAFVPLIFLSGIAGAIFFDQAFAITIGLLVSFFTGIILLPVSYKLAFSKYRKRHCEDGAQSNPSHFFSKLLHFARNDGTPKPSYLEKMYDAGTHWVFSHKTLTIILTIGILPLAWLFFFLIPKEKMPDISQNEIIVNVDWNENIHLDENRNRTEALLSSLDKQTIEHSALIGGQQYLLNREREQTSSECNIYLKTPEKKDIPEIKKSVTNYFSSHYPDAVFSFSPPNTIFDRIFTSGDPDLTVEYYAKNRMVAPDISMVRALEDSLKNVTGENPVSVPFLKQLNLQIDREKLLLYNVSYDDVYQALKTGFQDNEFSLLRSYQQYLPIVLIGQDQQVKDVIAQTLVPSRDKTTGEINKVPISNFITITPVEDLKTIVAGKNGEYIPVSFYNTNQPEKIIREAKQQVNKENKWDIDFSGTFFSNMKMFRELFVIMIISILLMYFILTAQFESFLQPLIVLLEIPIDLIAALGLLLALGHSLNLMSAIGLVVSCGIIINDSILKVDVMNQLRKSGLPVMEAIHEAGRRRLKAIVMTNLTAIVCMAPLMFSSNMGSEMEKPLAIATIGGMIIGTPVSLFVVPLVYWWIYRKKN
jgi:multidrug efflux pump subunit AcrB